MASYKTAQTLDVRTMGGVFGRGRLLVTTPATAIVTASQQCSIFLDGLGQNQASNVEAPGVTTSDSSMFNGRVPNGEIFTLWGMQIKVYEQNATDNCVATATQMNDYLKDLELSLSLKGQNYVIGNLQTLPSGLGDNTQAQNGGRAVAPFRFPRQLPLQLEGNDQFFVTIKATRNITLQNVDGKLVFFVYCPASRGIPVSQLSGA